MILFKKHELFDLIRSYLPDSPVIIEAGAFNGSDTKKIAAYWPHATIHAFEPVPEIFALLQEATASHEQVHTYNVALSNSTGTATFYVSEKPSKPGKPFQAGSLHAPHERLNWSPAVYKTTIQVPTITLDDWAVKHHVDHVDFLWLDAQGHELAILQAAPKILARAQVIYCEVQFIHAYENQPLYHEVKSWLENNGWQEIARDFKNETDWFFGNCVFIKR